MLAIGTLQSYSSDLPASLSLTQGQMTTNAPWLAWHTDQFTAGSHCEDGSSNVLRVATWNFTQFPWSLPAVALVMVSTLHHHHLDVPSTFPLSSFSLSAPWDTQPSQHSSPWTDYLMGRGYELGIA